MSCDLPQLQAIKATYGELRIKQACQLLSTENRDHIKLLCDNEQKEEAVAPVTEQTTIYKVETQPPHRKTTLIELTADLQQLDNLLDTIDGDIPVELQTAVDELLAQRDATQEVVLEKIDNYCELIQSRLMWAVARKAEAERIMKLAESDTKSS